MNRQESGAGGQFVTTWGRELENGVWTGPEHPITTTLTCVCGRSVSYKGFPHAAANRKAGFCRPLLTDEWFCNDVCAATHRTTEFKKVVAGLQEEVDAKTKRIEQLRQIVGGIDHS